MSLLHIWFGATALLIAMAVIWAYVPVLIPLLGITAGLGVLVAGIVTVVRALERRMRTRDH